MDNIYIVKYSGGSYDGYYTRDIFGTADESTAIAYVNKFNNILNNWKAYYKKFEDGDGWLRSDVDDEHFEKWYKLHQISRCYYEPLPVR